MRYVFIFSLICGMNRPHIKGIFLFKNKFIFPPRIYLIFVLLLYMFDLYEKPNFYFSNYNTFMTFKLNSPL